MKLALLGDIHSNDLALKECLEYCNKEGVEGYLFLGDYVSDCPEPQKTLLQIYDICKRYPTWCIRGNREDYQLSYHHGNVTGWKENSNSGSLLYTYEHLSEQDLNFFQRCPASIRISIEAMPEFIICHGSPENTSELLHFNSNSSKRYLKEIDTELLVCAHTHVQGIYEAYGRRLVNPGSVGLAMLQAGVAQFAILHSIRKQWVPEFITLEYDVENYIKQYQKSELPLHAKTFSKIIQGELLTGKNYLPQVIKKAYELALHTEATVDPNSIPETYWEQAYELLCHPIEDKSYDS